MHPLRSELHDELHVRPSIYFNEPAHVYHLTLLELGDALDRMVAALDSHATLVPDRFASSIAPGSLSSVSRRLAQACAAYLRENVWLSW